MESVAQRYDRVLEQLQEELQELNQKYAFAAHDDPEEDEGPGTPQPEQLKVKPAAVSHATPQLPSDKSKNVFKGSSESNTRYRNLPRLSISKEDVLPKTLLKPQISEKWLAELRAAPQLQDIYDRPTYEPEFASLDPTSIKAHFGSNPGAHIPTLIDKLFLTLSDYPILCHHDCSLMLRHRV